MVVPLRRRESGFTLIELLVVIAIICVLAAILFPLLQQAKERSYRTSCQSNLKQLMLAVNQYADDWTTCLPPVDVNWPGSPGINGQLADKDPWSLYGLLSRYCKKADVFKCEAVPWGYPWDPDHGNYGVVNYQYHPTAVWSGKPKKRDLVIRPTKSVLIMDMWEQFPHQGGSDYAFVDGHVQWFAEKIYGFKTGMPPFYYP